MRLAFFLPLDPKVLAIRYAAVTGLLMFMLWLYGEPPSGIAWAILPNPITAITHIPDVITSILSFTTGSWGFGFFVFWLLNLMQLGLLVGLIRYGFWHFRPDLIENLPLLGVPSLETSQLDGRRLRRPWWIVPVFMLFTTFGVVYLITGLIYHLLNPRYYQAVWMGMENPGPVPLFIALGLSVLGLFWGYRYTLRLKGLMGNVFGVQYLPADEALTQEVHRMATLLDIPPPRVGVMNVVNAYAAGPDPENAEVIIGRPLLRNLSKDEIRAIIGHELGHVVSGDMRQMQFAEGFQSMFGNVFTVVTTLVAAVAASQARDKTTRYAIQTGSSSFHMVGRALIGFVSELMVKGLSRSREYHADAIGASLSSPEAMASALEKIAQIHTPRDVEASYSYLMFFGSSFGNLFSTHPTNERRIAALRDGTYTRLLPHKK
ncbi:M48 family metalloprotease [Zhengella mangrovi]|nr:M48 family metalloprotease [Zhengella mangrovi]